MFISIFFPKCLRLLCFPLLVHAPAQCMATESASGPAESASLALPPSPFANLFLPFDPSIGPSFTWFCGGVIFFLFVLL